MKFDTNACKKLLMEHEGVEFTPYLDSKGILTVACGWNMIENPLPSKYQQKVKNQEPLSFEDCMELLDISLEGTVEEVCKLDWFEGLSYARKTVVCDMVYNLGLTRFLGFKKLIAAIKCGDFKKAADEMKNSKWASDVGSRAVKLQAMMLHDKIV